MSHGSANTVGFADGHVENHKWLDAGTVAAGLKASSGVAQGAAGHLRPGRVTISFIGTIGSRDGNEDEKTAITQVS